MGAPDMYIGVILLIFVEAFAIVVTPLVLIYGLTR
jgi:hypothetical protein